MLLKPFKDFINKNKLFSSDDNLLIAVSGGIDSVVLMHLAVNLENNCSIAHCNFQLRGADADGDQKFVKELANMFGYKFHSISFDTNQFAKKHQLSIQMAARELRYQWFYQLADEFNYNKILIAHNKNDVAETILLNLTRGTGIKGLTGIAVSTKKVVRPLLFAERDQIKNYATQHNIRFREDSSNKEIKYARNNIRHKVIPALSEINPSVLNNMEHTAHLLSEVALVYETHITNLKKELFEYRNNKIYIAKKKLQGLSPTIIFSLFEAYNFSYDTAQKLPQTLTEQAGKVFYSSSYQLVSDRSYMIIDAVKDPPPEIVPIKKGCSNISEPIHLQISTLTITKNFHFPVSKAIALFDDNKLSFPLTLRKWKHGDYFFPLGMQGRKKISDFFVDQKFSMIDKEDVWLLCSNEDIVWIVGHRIDDRYKITTETKQAVKLELIIK